MEKIFVVVRSCGIGDDSFKNNVYTSTNEQKALEYAKNIPDSEFQHPLARYVVVECWENGKLKDLHCFDR